MDEDETEAGQATEIDRKRPSEEGDVMTSSKQAGAERGQNGTSMNREERLAQALRDNLKRRKTAAKARKTTQT